jgi:hypothetical protein
VTVVVDTIGVRTTLKPVLVRAVMRDVVDVEFILGERAAPKGSERIEPYPGPNASTPRVIPE